MRCLNLQHPPPFSHRYICGAQTSEQMGKWWRCCSSHQKRWQLEKLKNFDGPRRVEPLQPVNTTTIPSPKYGAYRRHFLLPNPFVSLDMLKLYP